MNSIIRWSGVNALFFMSSFLAVDLLCMFFPQRMLAFFGKWASLLSLFGAKSAAEFASLSQMLIHILQRNAIAAIVYAILGLLLQAPLAMLFGGGFYAFIVFLAPLTIGRSFAFFDWLLITVEVLSLVLSASLTSGFSAELYQVSPSIRDWWQYSKKAWRSLSMKAPIDWKDILPAWSPTLLIGSIICASMILFVAWLEVYGF